MPRTLETKLSAEVTGVAVDLEDDVALLEAGVVGGGVGPDLLDDDAVDGGGKLELRPGVLVQVGDGETELAGFGLAGAVRAVVVGELRSLGVELADGEFDGLRLTVAEDADGD